MGPKSEASSAVGRTQAVEAANLREAILEGYDDVIHGRTEPYTGDLGSMLSAFRRTQQH